MASSHILRGILLLDIHNKIDHFCQSCELDLDENLIDLFSLCLIEIYVYEDELGDVW